MKSFKQFITEISADKITPEHFGYTVKKINRVPKKYYGKHFSHNKTIEVYTKGRTPEQVQNTIDHETGHILDYHRRGIISDPMGDSIMNKHTGKHEAMADHDIYFRDFEREKGKEAEEIRKQIQRTDSASTTKKEIYADAYKTYKQNPELLKKVAPKIHDEIHNHIKGLS